jgi:hypothetical protein
MAMGKQLSRMDEQSMMEGQRQGLLMMTIGKVLLGFDVILLAFVYDGLRSGSYMWVWWVGGQGLLALVLMAIGAQKRGALTD